MTKKLLLFTILLMSLISINFSAWWNANSESDRAYYFIEHDENNQPLSNGYIWIKGNFSTTPTSFYVYYNGNSEDTSMKNGKKVFEIFDDFEGTSLNTTLWNCYAGTCSVSNSVVSHTYSSTDKSHGLITTSTYPLHINAKIVYYAKCVASGTQRCWIGGEVWDSNRDMQMVARTSSGYFAYTINEGNLGSGAFSDWSTYSYIELDRTSNFKTYKNRAYVSMITSPLPDQDLHVAIWGEAGGTVYVDYVFVLYNQTTQTVNYGNEETGLWLLNGITYTKRKLVNVSTSSAVYDKQIYLLYSQFNSTNIAITSYYAQEDLSISILSNSDLNNSIIKRPFVKLNYTVTASSNITSITIYNNITSSNIVIYPNANNYTEYREIYFDELEGFYDKDYYYLISACTSSKCTNSTTQIIHRLQNITISSLQGPSSMTETTLQYTSYNLTHRGYFINPPTLVSKITYDTLVNNCTYTLTNLSTSNELLYNYVVYCPFTSRLQDTNNTSLTAIAYINFTYSQDGTSTLMEANRSKTINCLFGAYPTTMSIYDDKNPYITEMDTFRVQTNYVNSINAITSLNTEFNGLNYTGSKYDNFFIASPTTPSLTSNTNYNVVSYLIITKNGETKIRTKTSSFTAYKITISTCSDSNGYIRFDTKYINGTAFTSTQSHNILVLLDNGNKTYNVSSTGTSMKICISPKQFYDYTDEIFFTVGTKNQEYYIHNHEYNTSANNIVNLYGNDGSYIIDLTVYENSVNVKPNVIVELIKYNPTTFQSYTVEMGKTNSEGKISLFFTNNGYYKFNVYDTDGTQLYADLPTKLYTSTGIYYKTIYLSSYTAVSQNNIISSCVQNITTSLKQVYCSFYSLDGSQHNFTLVIKKKNTIVNQTSLYTSSGSLLLTTTDGTDAYLYAHSDPTPLAYINLRDLLTHDIEYSIIIYPLIIFITLVAAYDSIVGIILLTGTGVILNTIPEFENSLSLLLIPAVVMLIVFILSHYKRGS